MINITINNILENLWDNNGGFYSEFNGTNWNPLNTSQECKKTYENVLSIKMLLELFNKTGNNTFYNKAIETLQFLNNNLFDNIMGGYYTAVNASNYLTNTNKSTIDNAYLVDTLLELYNIDYNYTYYDCAEKVVFYLTTFIYSPSFNLFIPKSSKVGSVSGQESKVSSLSNFLVSNALINLEKIRTSFNHPLIINNITRNYFDISSTQKELTIYFEITDLNYTEVGNVSVFGYLFGVPELIEFNRSSDNITYYHTFDISMFSRSANFHILVLNDSYASTYTMYEYVREYPIYIKTAFETLSSYYTFLKNEDYYSGFYNSSYGYRVGTSGNLIALQAINKIRDTIGSTILTFNWEGNNTLINNMKEITNYLNDEITTQTTQNLSGFLEYVDIGVLENITKLFDNALAVSTFLDLYDDTNDSLYLELANQTWLYLNNTFWDPSLNCYRSDNSSQNNNISVVDNFLAILAGIRINQTIEINSTIRNQALRIVNLTYNTINSTFWDQVNGGYYRYANGSSWTDFWNKDTIGNSLGIIVNLEMYRIFHNSSYYNTSCYRMANSTAQIMKMHLWDPLYGGFYHSKFSNWSLPNSYLNTSKYTLDNSWAAIAFLELYNISNDYMDYYYAERSLQFLITYMGNQTVELTTPGFYTLTNRSGYVYTIPTANIYPGDLLSSSLCIKALLSLFNIINISYLGDWLNATVEFSAASYPPIGEYANITLLLKDKNNNNQTGDINVTIIKWHLSEAILYPKIYNNLEATFNENTSEYNVGNINISNSEYIYIYISAINVSFASYYGIFFIQRVSTDIISVAAYKDNEMLRFLPIFGGAEEDPEKDYAYYAYVLGEDRIQIKARFVDMNSPDLLGIVNTAVNATIYFANNGSKWESKIVYTDSDGWLEVFFGPIANQSILEGIYNVTLFATHVNTTIRPNTWYSSTSHLVRISVGYGLFIANYTTSNFTIAQGDIFEVNITIKNERVSNAGTNISFYGEKEIIVEFNRSVNVDPGYTSFLQDLKIDERTPTGEYDVYADITYQSRWVHTYYFAITIRDAVEINSIIIPDKIAQDDQREFLIEVTNFKKQVNSNLLIKMQSPALNDFSISKSLNPNETREFYISFEPTETIPYGSYTGLLEIQRQNYSLSYQGSEQHQFSIEITTFINLVSCKTPSSLLQGQNGFISLCIENYRTKESKIQIVYYWENSGEINKYNYTLTEYYEEEYIYIPISYINGLGDFGSHNLIIEIYYINENDTKINVYNTIESIDIQLSTLGFFLYYFLPFLIVLMGVIITLYLILRRKEEKKKQKK